MHIESHIHCSGTRPGPELTNRAAREDYVYLASGLSHQCLFFMLKCECKVLRLVVLQGCIVGTAGTCSSTEAEGALRGQLGLVALQRWEVNCGDSWDLLIY